MRRVVPHAGAIRRRAASLACSVRQMKGVGPERRFCGMDELKVHWPFTIAEIVAVEVDCSVFCGWLGPTHVSPFQRAPRTARVGTFSMSMKVSGTNIEDGLS